MTSLSLTAAHSPLHAGKYLFVAPDGARIEVPRELFVAIQDFVSTRKDAGSMVVHFRNGGIAGVETLVKKKYK